MGAFASSKNQEAFGEEASEEDGQEELFDPDTGAEVHEQHQEPIKVSVRTGLLFDLGSTSLCFQGLKCFQKA